MPWEHCGRSDILDDAKCPVCAITKAQWTLEWGKTRDFKVARRGARLKLILHDANGQPIPGAAYRIELPDGSILEGKLDAQGYAAVDAKGAKTCRVTFPELPDAAWRPTSPGAGAGA